MCLREPNAEFYPDCFVLLIVLYFSSVSQNHFPLINVITLQSNLVHSNNRYYKVYHNVNVQNCYKIII